MNSFKRGLLAMGSAIALMTGAAPAFAYTNTAYINQPGNDNTAYQNQSGYAGNNAVIKQDGTSGSASQVQQRTASNFYSNNYASIVQSGFANSASQNQVGAANTASILQGGAHNTASQSQSGFFYGSGGYLNLAVIEQGAAGYYSSFNTAHQLQYGRGNYGRIYQNGGNGNYAWQRQCCLYNQSIAIQSGSYNTARQINNMPT
jgi:hypothetical protein